MKLKELLQGVQPRSELDGEALEQEVTSLAMRASECVDGSVFFAIKGYKRDGTEYAAEAVERGAVAVVTENNLGISTTEIIVDDVRATLSLMAGNFYYNAHKELKIIAVTGTNGKTTTAGMIARILSESGKNVAVFGTLGVTINGREIPSELTTPDPIELNRLFQIARLAGVEYVVMEVSAHAIALRKMEGIKAHIAVFTNLTQDHLDFFGTMDEYAKCKASYFTAERADFAVVNSDDEWGRHIINTTSLPTATYGIHNPADTFALDADCASGTRCIVNSFDDIFELLSPFSGEFNLYNALAAITVARLLSISPDVICRSFLRMPEVKGRFNIIESSKKVIIDFAHTPDGLRNLLVAARAITKGKLIAVFGCGGDRDRGKRPVMGRIAAEYADFTVLTSDNSRFEEPPVIIGEIESGYREVSSSYIAIPERSGAISYALMLAAPEDIVVIAGKGAEPYMDVKGVKYPYSDRAEVLEIFRRYNL